MMRLFQGARIGRITLLALFLLPLLLAAMGLSIKLTVTPDPIILGLYTIKAEQTWLTTVSGWREMS